VTIEGRPPPQILDVIREGITGRTVHRVRALVRQFDDDFIGIVHVEGIVAGAARKVARSTKDRADRVVSSTSEHNVVVTRGARRACNDEVIPCRTMAPVTAVAAGYT